MSDGYRTGHIAVGATIGLLMAILAEPFSSLVGIDAEVWSNETLVAAIVTGGLGYWGAYHLYTKQRNFYIRTAASSVRYVLYLQLVSLMQVQKLVDNAKKKSINFKQLHFLSLLNVSADAISHYDVSPEHMSALGEAISGDDLQNFVKNILAHQFLARRFRDLILERDQVLSSYPELSNLYIAHGEIKVEVSILEDANKRLALLEQMFGYMHKEMADLEKKTFDLLNIVDDGIRRRTGEKPLI